MQQRVILWFSCGDVGLALSLCGRGVSPNNFQHYL